MFPRNLYYQSYQKSLYYPRYHYYLIGQMFLTNLTNLWNQNYQLSLRCL